MSGWAFERLRGGAGELHALGVPDRAVRSVRVLDVDAPALVLGSTQSEDDVDVAACAAHGVAVARRRSGGGAVLLEPGRVVWADVVVPADDPLWSDDVGYAFAWLGEVWVEALTALGLASGLLHRGGLIRTRWSSLVCFAGVGPGEVLVDGAKVVGMAQRRTRDGALFQCAVPLAWEAADTLALLALSGADRTAAACDMAGRVRPLDGVAAADVVHALRLALPA